MEPRWYQSECTEAAWKYIREQDGNPALVLPTGAGKSLVIAMLARDTVSWGGRSVILAHRKELLEQNASKVMACAPGLQVGIYSAGLGKKDHMEPVVCAGIQSCYKMAPAYNLGHRDTIIVDEAHMIPSSDNGIYREFINHMRTINPRVRVIGLTATPYRLDSGTVCGQDCILDEIAYEVPLAKLIEQGHLSKLSSKLPEAVMDVTGVRTKCGDFIKSDLDRAASVPEVVREAVKELLSWTVDRKSVLVFCCGRSHAQHVLEALQGMGVNAGYVDGVTSPTERANTLENFKAGQLKYLINIDVLTTGFDAPGVDCVALLRPTQSPGLYYQMVGRGFRTAPGKEDCLILDFAGNIMRHGPVDKLDCVRPKKSSAGGVPMEPPVKACPECRETTSLAQKVCSNCGYNWPEKDPAHDTIASTAPILSSQARVTRETLDVYRTDYLVYAKEDGQRVFRAIHKVRGMKDSISEYVCLEHPPGSWARKKAEEWWARHSDWPYPVKGCWDAYHVQKNHQVLSPTLKVTIKRIPGAKWPEVIGTELAEKPAVNLDELEDHNAMVEVLHNLFKWKK